MELNFSSTNIRHNQAKRPNCVMSSLQIISVPNVSNMFSNGLFTSRRHQEGHSRLSLIFLAKLILYVIQNRNHHCHMDFVTCHMDFVSGFSRLDEQIFINRNEGMPGVVRFHPYDPHLAVADKEGVR